MVTVIPLRLDAFAAKSGTFPTALPVQREEREQAQKKSLSYPKEKKVSEGTGCRRCTGV